MSGLTTKPIPSISLYILTDGEFEDESPDFATPIGELLQRLRAAQSILPTFLSVTIIQFGNGDGAHHALLLIQDSVSNLDNVPPNL